MSPIGSIAEKKIKKIFLSLAVSRIRRGNQQPLGTGPGLSVLALRPDRLGDFILSAPALRALALVLGRRNRLTLVAGERSGALAGYLFPSAKVLVFRKSLWGRFSLYLKLWLGRFDAVIDFHSYPFSTTSALLALASGSGRRIGFWDKGPSSALSHKVFNWGLPRPAENLHEGRKSLRLARRLFPEIEAEVSSFPLPPVPVRIQAQVEDFMARLRPGSTERIVAVHPTLQKKDNRWSPANYLLIVRALMKRPRVKVVVVYGKGEEGDLMNFLEELGPFPRVFPLPSSELLLILEFLKRSDVFVGGDSGLTHLASLVTRVVALFGPSHPGRWGPLDAGWGKPKVLRKKDRLCDSIGTGEVVTEIKRAIAYKKRKTGF